MEEDGERGRRTHDAFPTLVVSFLDHQVAAFAVVVCISGAICHSRWDDGYAVEGPVFLHAIDDFFPRCSFQGFFVCAADGFDGAGQERSISCKESGVIRSIVVVPSRDIIESVDRVRARDMLFPEVRSPIGSFCLPFEDLERAVGLITRKAGCQR